MKYISTIYNEKSIPKTGYPSQLIQYLIQRFGLSCGDKVLEIGCGRGDFLNAFKEAGLICSGIDRDLTAINFSPNLEIKICDLEKENIPYKNEYFDIVYHKSLIEHLYSPNHLMEETYRVLKKNGKLIILTPDWVSQMKVFYEDITHCRPYDEKALADTFSLFGFKDVIVEKFYQLPILWKYKFLKSLSFFLRLVFGVKLTRLLTKKTGIKFFRWSVELMVLGYGRK